MVKKTNNKNLTVKDFFAKIKALEDNEDVILNCKLLINSKRVLICHILETSTCNFYLRLLNY